MKNLRKNQDNETSISVVIITKNESSMIVECLKSLDPRWSVVVVDSGSSDGTVQLLKERGVEVHHRAFDNYSNQKNAAVGYASGKWILSLDADERLTPELCDKVNKIAQTDSSGCYRIRRRLIFQGKKMKHGRTVDYPTRLFSRGAGQFKGKIHEKFVPQIPIDSSVLKEEIYHYSYRDLKDYFERLNLYTSKIVENYEFQGKRVPSKMTVIFRPFFDFHVRFFLKLGFLDGYQGFCYAFLSSVYGFVKYAKFLELEGKKGT